MSIARRARRTETNIWPAFVDAQGQLLIAIIFVLLVLSVFQFVTTDVLSGKDQTLQQLSRQLNELNEMLALERQTGADLRSNAGQLAAELQNANAQKDQLTTRVAELAARAQDEAARADRLSSQAADLTKTVTADKATVEMQLRELESLRRDIQALRQVRQELEAKVGDLAAAQAKSQQDLTAARDRSKELEARLATAEERTALAQKEIQERDIRLSQSEQALGSEKKLTADAQSQINMLNQQINALRDQLQRISSALELSEGKTQEQQVQLADLTKRLNVALASKVEELARYRSEFFGKLREILGDRQDIRVVGDRFVFQSEVLFPPGSADLGDNAPKLEPIAAALKEIAPKIPPDLNWVLRVDGHTDRRPISTPQFPSNWYLSTGRAIAVVNQLIALGVPAEHLSAAGFGEFQPIDSRNDEIGWRRNRRIELKLTER